MDEQKWELIKELFLNRKPDELPEPYDSIAPLVGVENTYEIAKSLGGINLYFPACTKLLAEARGAAFSREYLEGMSFSAIAKKYGVTTVTVRKYVKEFAEKKAQSRKK